MKDQLLFNAGQKYQFHPIGSLEDNPGKISWLLFYFYRCHGNKNADEIDLN